MDNDKKTTNKIINPITGKPISGEDRELLKKFPKPRILWPDTNRANAQEKQNE